MEYGLKYSSVITKTTLGCVLKRNIVNGTLEPEPLTALADRNLAFLVYYFYSAAEQVEICDHSKISYSGRVRKLQCHWKNSLANLCHIVNLVSHYPNTKNVKIK